MPVQWQRSCLRQRRLSRSRHLSVSLAAVMFSDLVNVKSFGKGNDGSSVVGRRNLPATIGFLRMPPWKTATSPNLMGTEFVCAVIYS